MYSYNGASMNSKFGGSGGGVVCRLVSLFAYISYTLSLGQNYPCMYGVLGDSLYGVSLSDLLSSAYVTVLFGLYSRLFYYPMFLYTAAVHHVQAMDIPETSIQVHRRVIR